MNSIDADVICIFLLFMWALSATAIAFMYWTQTRQLKDLLFLDSIPTFVPRRRRKEPPKHWVN